MARVLAPSRATLLVALGSLRARDVASVMLIRAFDCRQSATVHRRSREPWPGTRRTGGWVVRGYYARLGMRASSGLPV